MVVGMRDLWIAHGREVLRKTDSHAVCRQETLCDCVLLANDIYVVKAWPAHVLLLFLTVTARRFYLYTAEMLVLLCSPSWQTDC